jgi:hypothetical protein
VFIHPHCGGHCVVRAYKSEVRHQSHTTLQLTQKSTQWEGSFAWIADHSCSANSHCKCLGLGTRQMGCSSSFCKVCMVRTYCKSAVRPCLSHSSCCYTHVQLTKGNIVSFHPLLLPYSEQAITRLSLGCLSLCPVECSKSHPLASLVCLAQISVSLSPRAF